MAHELAGALQQTSRIRQRCSLKESNVYVGREYVDVTKGWISQTCSRTAVMQKLPDFVSTVSHHLKPFLRDGSQLTCMLFHPAIDGRITLDSAVQSKQFCSRSDGDLETTPVPNSYIAITDHSKGLKIAGGIDEDQLREVDYLSSCGGTTS